MADAPRYEHDFYAWTQDQAARLRTLKGDNRFDVDHIAGEIADLGARDRRALANTIEVVLEHLLMLAASPATAPRRHWLDEVDNHRRAIRDIRDDSPSLPDRIDLARAWQRTVRAANRKLARYQEPTVDAPSACPVTIDALADDAVEPETLVAPVAQGLDPRT